jgi:membrane-associated protein
MLEPMLPLGGLEGPLAILALCGLLLIEEAGVPLPMFPGDGLLLAAGVMIAGGVLSPWLFLPLAYASVVAGAVIGYAWSARVGRPGLARLADRLHVRRHLDVASSRLRQWGPAGVVVGRLLPGTRVYTNLVAGSAGMPFGTYVAGLLPSTAAWLAIFVGLGAAAGGTAAAHSAQLRELALLVAAHLALAGVVLAALRGIRPPAGPRWPSPDRLCLAAAVDLLLVVVVASVAHHVVFHDVLGVTLAGLGVAAAYLVAARLSAGQTAGERLTGVSYARIRLHPTTA